MAGQWIYWFSQLGQGDCDLVGRKCANLGEMTKLGMRVPPGFAISVDGYSRFMALTGLDRAVEAIFARYGEELKGSVAKQIEVSRAVQELIRSTPMPKEMAAEIGEAYESLCRATGMSDVAVAVRSSGAVSMPGQMDSYLNVRGGQEVIRKVIEVWESTFNTRAIAFRLEKGMRADVAPIGVAVLKMVNAKSAGVVLTVIPSSADLERTVIEGNWGLGESVVSGEITPDNFIVEKATSHIERKIARKKHQVVFNGRGTAKAEVPEELQEAPCLSDPEVLEIAAIASRVEEYFGVPQDMEWVIDRDMVFPENVFWVQARSAKYVPRKAGADVDYLIDQMARFLTM